MKSGFGQFCPVAVACEVFAERWTPIILRELLAGSHRFNEIHRCIPLISRALLVKRLRTLEAAGVITKMHGSEYHLTESGEEFRSVIVGLGTWGQRWTLRVQPENLDAGLLMWSIRRRIAKDRLPARRVVVNFNFSGVPARYRGARKFWLLLERSGVDVCVRDPGFEVDIWLDADLTTMAKVYLGDLAFSEGLREKKIRMRGMPSLIRQFPAWLLNSPYAKVPRPLAGEAIRA
ncbi:MAG: winged helix-turn-helix transcriptional regulator [Burkholderiales bacterium]